MGQEVRSTWKYNKILSLYILHVLSGGLLELAVVRCA